MGKSNQRDVYFSKNILSQKTPAEFIAALQRSPYRTHQRKAAEIIAEIQQHEREMRENTEKSLASGDSD